MDETRRDIDQTRPIDPVRPADQTRPIDPVRPADRTHAVDPVRPAGQTHAVEPTSPVDRVRPLDGTRPVDPTRPMEAGSTPTAPDDGVSLRFGPGVPPELARKWRGRSATRRSPSRRVVGGLLTLGVAVLAGLLVWWLLRGGPGVTVTGVSVSAPKTTQSCDTTVRVVGTIRTDGGYGDIAYRWRRSDGQVSGMLSESVPKGRRSVEVPLRWTVKGTGTMHAVATLEVVRPGKSVAHASGAFDYACD